jgi:hypothetical protein
MEHVNQELKRYLWVFVSEQQGNWMELFPLAELQYNNHAHASTQHSPFLLDTRCHPHMGFKSDEAPSHMETVNEFQDQMVSPLEEAKSTLAKAKTTWHSTTTATALQHQCTRSETWCTWIPGTSTPPNHPRNLYTAALDPTRLQNVLEPMPTASNSPLLCPTYTQFSMLSSCFWPCKTKSLVNDPPQSQNRNSLTERNTMRLRQFLTANSSRINCKALLLGKAMVMRRIPGQMWRM